MSHYVRPAQPVVAVQFKEANTPWPTFVRRVVYHLATSAVRGPYGEGDTIERDFGIGPAIWTPDGWKILRDGTYIVTFERTGRIELWSADRFGRTFIPNTLAAGS